MKELLIKQQFLDIYNKNMKHTNFDSKVIRDEIEDIRLKTPKVIKSKNMELGLFDRFKIFIKSLIKKVS